MGRDEKVEWLVTDKIKRIQELQGIQSSIFVQIHSLYEELFRELSGGGELKALTKIHDLKGRWQAAENELLQLSYCVELLDKVGAELHDLYQQRHPINRLTSFVKVADYINEVHYYLQEEAEFSSTPPSPYANIRRGVAKMETWANRDQEIYIRLAYAPETNTLYWR